MICILMQIVISIFHDFQTDNWFDIALQYIDVLQLYQSRSVTHSHYVK